MPLTIVLPVVGGSAPLATSVFASAEADKVWEAVDVALAFRTAGILPEFCNCLSADSPAAKKYRYWDCP